MSDLPPLLIRGHLGLGDMLVCNGLVRRYSENHRVTVLCKEANVPTVEFMYRDHPNIAVGPVENDHFANVICDLAIRRNGKVLKLGMFAKGFDEKRWGESMYEQAGVPFEERWTGFKVKRKRLREFEPPINPYVFIHEDCARGFDIDDNRIENCERQSLIRTTNFATYNIFDYCRLIEYAEEIHCIDSCFAILADSLPRLNAKRFAVHHYARNGLMPKYRFPVEILR